MDYEQTFLAIIEIIVCLSSVGLGFGLSFWICGIIIDKSNNYGDSQRTNRDYGTFIHFTARRDRLSFRDRKSFAEMYTVKLDAPSSGPNDNEPVRRLSAEELAMYDGTTAEDAAAKREEMLKQKSVFDRDLSGVFRPLKEK